MKHDVGRWICQTHPHKCDGSLTLHARRVPCPLAKKCLDPAARWTPYEYPLSPKRMGHYCDLVDPMRPKLYRRRYAQLCAAFIPEHMREVELRNRPAKHERYAIRAQEERERKAQAIQTETPGETVLLPCGEDCRNCPYEECRYTDADKDAILNEERRERLREQWRASRARKKARDLVDPEYAERRRQQNLERRRRHYAKKKQKEMEERQNEQRGI